MVMSSKTIHWLRMAGFLLIDSGSQRAVCADSANYLGRGRATYGGHLGIMEPTLDVVQVKEI